MIDGFSCRLQFAGYMLHAASCNLQIAGCKMQVSGCRLYVEDCMLHIAHCMFVQLSFSTVFSNSDGSTIVIRYLCLAIFQPII